MDFSDISEKRENWMISDLHIHSSYSRACSKNINFSNLVKWAKIKGIHLLGTGDFTHPVWFEEIKKLRSNGKGFYFYEDFPFVVSGEVSLMYTQEKGRRIHLVLLVPSVETAEKVNFYLDKKGRRDYDGRPIFNISGEDFTRDIKEISDEIEIIPGHAWTPWFGVFGSNSGFDSLKECFGSQTEKINAIETGISSDPEMNWKLKELENKAILSFSDSHSFWPFRLGREATIFKKTDSYGELIKQIREINFIGTIETDHAYGKYHWDGHRLCNFCVSPEETIKLKGICPKCSKPLTIGVEYRLKQISDNNSGKIPAKAKPFFRILPLHEIISFSEGAGIQSTKTWKIYNDLIEKFSEEFNILLQVSFEEMIKAGVGEKLAGLIIKNRNAKIKVKPGYDGIYGEAVIEGLKKETQFTL